MPKNIVVKPIVLIFLNSLIKSYLINKYPTIITGREDINILKNNFLF